MTHAALPWLLLLGGSFNPPHIGHLRIAIEGREALRPEKTLLIPAASPPHKPDARLLPFEMRVEMLKKSLASLPPEWRLDTCEVENEREGPSYTIDTLEILFRRYPGNRLAFLMGAEDYSQLSSWYRWHDIPTYADIVVIPRKEHASESFHRNTLVFWPEALTLPEPRLPRSYAAQAVPPPLCSHIRYAYVLPGGGKCLYLPLALLEISSSLVRQRFLSALSLDFLVPPAVLAMLQENTEKIRNAWD